MKTLTKQTTQNFPFGGFRGLFLLLLWGADGLFEGLSAAVTVTPLSVDYSTKKVTFKVSWNAAPANNRAWVWIDFCPVAGTVPTTSFSTATITNPAKTGGNGTITNVTARGFFIEYSSATNAGTTVTATLSNTTGQFNWCAYGSDYPPNAIDNTGGGYDLRGTPPFVINGSISWSAYTYSGGTINTLTDATGCPGALCGKNGEAAGLLNCCVTGTTNCSGMCTTTGTYTTNDGACAGKCNAAYVRLRNQCGVVINSTYGTYTNTGCTTPNYTTNDGVCTGTCNKAYVQLRNSCGVVINTQYSTYNEPTCAAGCSPVKSSHCPTADSARYIAWWQNDPDGACKKWCQGYKHYYNTEHTEEGAVMVECWCCN
jgi:hypothetical protein